jgi:hypothetical protein
MAYCGPRGIALDAFLSWPQESQDAALQWQAYEARRCGSCGTHADDWNPDKGGSRAAWHAHLDVCPGCVARERASNDPGARDIRGAAVRLAHGSPVECARCNPDDAARR